MYSSLLRRSRLRTSSNADLLLAMSDFLNDIRVCLSFRDSMLLLSCREVEMKESAMLRIMIMNTINQIQEIIIRKIKTKKANLAINKTMDLIT